MRSVHPFAIAILAPGLALATACGTTTEPIAGTSLETPAPTPDESSAAGSPEAEPLRPGAQEPGEQAPTTAPATAPSEPTASPSTSDPASGQLVVAATTTSGAPVPGAKFTVSAMDACYSDGPGADLNPRFAARGGTGSDGVMTIEGLAPGCYSVTLTEAPTAHLPVPSGLFGGEIAGDNDTLTVPIEFYDGPARLPENVVDTTLRVTDLETNDPIDGLGIRLQRCDTSGIDLITPPSDDSGIIELELANTCYDAVGVAGTTAPCAPAGITRFTPEGNSFEYGILINQDYPGPGTC
ncbi:prealbumin-like fold domain-containing protein [Lolliginicoccus suaedae]|uniref:prealbumin-like fold domain-containing protein n=1 Tax=Lolliginicoccus suaedae TaxID=2605429 RepID=UPI0011EC6E38|nr:prealbumin-like fold domain-containing protein [Lolliginicoccus suaedae]